MAFRDFDRGVLVLLLVMGLLLFLPEGARLEDRVGVAGGDRRLCSGG